MSIYAKNKPIDLITANVFHGCAARINELPPALLKTADDMGPNVFAETCARDLLIFIAQEASLSKVLAALAGVGAPSDIAEIEVMLAELGRVIPHAKVLLMPEGTTMEVLRARAGWLSELCKARGYRYAPRLHVELYGNKRGT